MTIGIAIPTYIEHIKYLDRLLDSIEASTVKPDEVSICMSECDWKGGEYSFKLLITQLNDRKNPAQNLNTAISCLSTDIVSIIGGDDMIHPQRNQFLLEVFKHPHIHVVVHNFEYGKNENDYALLKDYDEIILHIDCLDTVTDKQIFPICSSRDIQYANGFGTYRREIFEQYFFNESEAAEFKEDSFFNRNLVIDGYKITYIENKLALYIKNPNRKP